MWLTEENEENMLRMLEILKFLEQNYEPNFFSHNFCKRCLERDCLYLTSRNSRKHLNPSKSEDLKTFPGQLDKNLRLFLKTSSKQPRQMRQMRQMLIQIFITHLKQSNIICKIK